MPLLFGHNTFKLSILVSRRFSADMPNALAREKKLHAEVEGFLCSNRRREANGARQAVANESQTLTRYRPASVSSLVSFPGAIQQWFIPCHDRYVHLWSTPNFICPVWGEVFRGHCHSIKIMGIKMPASLSGGESVWGQKLLALSNSAVTSFSLFSRSLLSA